VSIKVREPKVDPETAARQRQAEQRAEAGRIEATQEGVSEQTRAVIRQFGKIGAFAGAPSLATVGSFQRLAIPGDRPIARDYFQGLADNDIGGMIARSYARLR
jgi:hypothetical protein